MKLIVGAVIGLVLLKFYLVGSQPGQPPKPAPERIVAPAPEPETVVFAGQEQSLVLPAGDDRIAWGMDFLSRIGNDKPTVDTLGFVWSWQGGENTQATFNPLATTQNAPGATCFNYLSGGCGVKNYPDYETGLNASVETIMNGHYPNILAGLQSNDVSQAMNGEELGIWGTGLENVQRKFEEWNSQMVPSFETLAPQQPTTTAGTAGVSDVRAALVSYALSLQGIPYVRGGRSASGGDCSGTMEHVYLSVTGIDIGTTTFSQYPGLEHIDISQVKPGDLWYGQYSDDQHTGMVADVDGDGTWDLINNGGLAGNMHVDYNFMSMEYFAAHTMGFARAISD